MTAGVDISKVLLQVAGLLEDRGVALADYGQADDGVQVCIAGALCAVVSGYQTTIPTSLDKNERAVFDVALSVVSAVIASSGTMPMYVRDVAGASVPAPDREIAIVSAWSDALVKDRKAGQVIAAVRLAAEKAAAP